MLNKLRQAMNPGLNRIGCLFASTGMSPGFWTALSLILAASSGLTYMSAMFLGSNWYLSSMAGSILLLISGFFDIVDGCVARVTKQTSKKGAYLDSVFDKISESIIFIGLAIGGLANPVISLIALSISLIVSYTRAKSEAVGVELKGVGIGERAERLLLIGILGLIPLEGILQIAVILVCILAGITLFQRMYYTVQKL
ncbi:MAG: CDP-alcohol phosphatidyltransferase family protein [Nitrososphaeraceae archaeon]